MDKISAITAIAISSGDSAPMFSPIGQRTLSSVAFWMPLVIQDSVNDFHFERLPMAPIRGKDFPSKTRSFGFSDFQQMF